MRLKSHFLSATCIIILCMLMPYCAVAQDNKKDRTEKPKVMAPSQIYSPLGAKPIPQTSERDLAKQYYNSGDYEKAAVLYEKIYEEEPTYNNYRLWYYCLVGSGDYDAAVLAVKKAKRNDKRNKGRYDVDEGYVYILKGDGQKGYKLFDNAIKNLRADNNEVNILASSFGSIREYEYAIKTFLRGRELLKDKNRFGISLATYYYRDGNHKSAVKEFLNTALDESRQKNVIIYLESYLDEDKEGKFSEALREEFLLRTQKYPDVEVYSNLMLWYTIQVGDYELAFRQLKADDKIHENDGAEVLDFAMMCAQNHEFKVAQQAFEYLISEYKNDNPAIVLLAKIGRLDMAYNILQSGDFQDKDKILELDKKFDEVLNETSLSIDVYQTVINAANLKVFYLDDYQGAISLLEPLTKSTRNLIDVARVKLALGDIYIASGDPWEAILTYSQVEKSYRDDPIGHEAKYRNALVSYYIGEFNWAEAKLDVLKASTEKLIANDAMRLSLFIKNNKDEDSISLPLQLFAKADLAIFNKKYDAAIQYLDSAANVNAFSEIEDDVLLRKAKIFIVKEQFTEADSVLSILENQYPDEIIADEAIYTRAYINELYIKDIEKAMQLYQKVVIEYPDSVFAITSRERYRFLRGDKNVVDDMLDEEIIYIPIFN